MAANASPLPTPCLDFKAGLAASLVTALNVSEDHLKKIKTLFTNFEKSNLKGRHNKPMELRAFAVLLRTLLKSNLTASQIAETLQTKKYDQSFKDVMKLIREMSFESMATLSDEELKIHHHIAKLSAALTVYESQKQISEDANMAVLNVDKLAKLPVVIEIADSLSEELKQSLAEVINEFED